MYSLCDKIHCYWAFIISVFWTLWSWWSRIYTSFVSPSAEFKVSFGNCISFISLKFLTFNYFCTFEETLHSVIIEMKFVMQNISFLRAIKLCCFCVANKFTILIRLFYSLSSGFFSDGAFKSSLIDIEKMSRTYWGLC